MILSAATRARLLALGPIEPDGPSWPDWRGRVSVSTDPAFEYFLIDGWLVVNRRYAELAKRCGMGDRVTGPFDLVNHAGAFAQNRVDEVYGVSPSAGALGDVAALRGAP